MAIRLPIDFVAEYRGSKSATQFTAKDTGEVVSVAAKLKFEQVDDSGDVQLIEIGATQLDRCEPPFDHASITRGDEVRIRGFVIVQDRGSDRDSYMQVTSVMAVPKANGGAPPQRTPATAAA